MNLTPEEIKDKSNVLLVYDRKGKGVFLDRSKKPITFFIRNEDTTVIDLLPVAYFYSDHDDIMCVELKRKDG